MVAGDFLRHPRTFFLGGEENQAMEKGAGEEKKKKIKVANEISLADNLEAMMLKASQRAFFPPRALSAARSVPKTPLLGMPPGTGGLCALAVGEPGSLRAMHGSAHAAGGQGGSWLGQHVAPQRHPPATLEAEWGGSAGKLAAYALWAAAAKSEHHRRARPENLPG